MAVLELRWQVGGHCHLLMPPQRTGRSQLRAPGLLHPRPGHPFQESLPGVHSTFLGRCRGGWRSHTYLCIYKT